MPQGGDFFMKMTNEEYGEYLKKMSPPSPLVKDMAKAFLVGGIICCVGQAMLNIWGMLGLSEEDSATATSISLVFLGAFLTGIGVYDDIAKFAGAGTLVPITGFANAVVSPALEFKSEGYITGTAAKMFTISGPVIVFGLAASVIYGIILAIVG
jgi:stage V sporulation protein AC